MRTGRIRLEKLRAEYEKLKKMGWRDRGWYIWAYYKIPILIGLVVLFLAYQAAGAFMRSRQDCMLYCAFIDQSAAGERQIEQMKKDFYDRQGFSGREVLTFDASINLTDEAFRNASAILFQSLLGTDTVDVVITKRDIVEQYQEQNVWQDLEKVLPEEMLESRREALCYGIDENGQAVPVGISLGESALVSEYGLDGDSVFCVCTLENHPEVIVDFVEFAFRG